MKKTLTVTQEQILYAISLGTVKLQDIARTLDLTKEQVERDISMLIEHGYVLATGMLGKAYNLTAEGLNALGTPKVELDVIRESTVVKSGEHSKLTITASNVGAAPAASGVIRIISPKVLHITRFGCEYTEDPEHNVLEYYLSQLNPGETQTVMFDLYATLPSGIMSSKYKLTVQCYVGDTVTYKSEISLNIESPSMREELE
ncbi:MAG: hypothetical protein AB1626_03865 [Candidatus Micrarchaeota archaeon]